MSSKYPNHETQLRFFRDAVKFASIVRDSEGDPVKHLRPETFAVMTDITDVGTDNWGFDSEIKYEDFYFNRTLEKKKGAVGQEQVNYPAVFMIASPGQSIQYKNFYDKRRKLIEYELAVVDLFQNSTHSAIGKKRPQQRVILDCEKILEGVLIYFDGIVFADYVVSGENKRGWFHKKELDWLLAETTIESFSIDRRVTELYKQKIKDENNNASFTGDVYRDMSINSLYGVYVVLKLPVEQCETGEYTFREYGDYKFGKCY